MTSDMLRIKGESLFNFSKAFDRTIYKILIVKLRDAPLSLGTFIDCIISHGTQVVRDKWPSSSLRTLLLCVSQGSVLGPVLFSLHLSDFGSTFNYRYNFYTDDLIIYLDYRQG